MSLTLSSSSFAHDERIPPHYTCQEADVSPPLTWTDPPPNTKSVALIVDDPDAPGGTWVHWVIYQLPSSLRALPEAIPADDTLPDGSRQGLNDFHQIGYRGPCPPPGPAHRYRFTLYALDASLTLPQRVTRATLEQAIAGHMLAHAQLIGRFQR